jgi:hypothetical protein
MRFSKRQGKQEPRPEHGGAEAPVSMPVGANISTAKNSNQKIERHVKVRASMGMVVRRRQPDGTYKEEDMGIQEERVIEIPESEARKLGLIREEE